MSPVRSSTSSAQNGGAAPLPRLACVDNLRTFMIVLVVHMHACVTYSHVGSWYRMEDPEPAMLTKIAFMCWQGHMQAFFMGLLFFIAGVFAHHSLTRRGPAAFLLERARRLGLPSLLYMVAIQPFMVYVLLGYPHVPDRPPLATLYKDYLLSGRVFGGNGPMWFALALLFFCVVLAGAWLPRTGSSRVSVNSSAAPSVPALLAFVVAVVLITFLVRTVQPFGTSVLNFQLCFFTQYIAAFAVGLLAGKHGWLETLAGSRRARLAGWLGLFGGPLLMVLIVAVGGPPPERGPVPYFGGWNVRALALAAWEQLAGLGLALGAMAWFQRRWNCGGGIATWLSERSFAVYVLHAPVLVVLTPLLRSVAVNPFVGAAALTVVGVVASFLVADLAKRVPGLRWIL